jgi:crossover junction endodeoxyribonuclease RusA
MELEFFVPGVAKPQGSKRHVGRGVMVESCKTLKPWREVVSYTAGQVVPNPTDRPVRLWLNFAFSRPKGHYGAKGLKPSAPEHLTSRALGDADKLARAICDSLTGIVYADDSQIIELSVRKRYALEGEKPGVRINIREAA